MVPKLIEPQDELIEGETVYMWDVIPTEDSARNTVILLVLLAGYAGAILIFAGSALSTGTYCFRVTHPTIHSAAPSAEKQP